MGRSLLSGETFFVTEDGHYYEECCDCSLTHYVHITKSPDGFLLTVWRDDFQTGLNRKHKRKKLKKRK